jgi:hypothetical protein
VSIQAAREKLFAAEGTAGAHFQFGPCNWQKLSEADESQPVALQRPQTPQELQVANPEHAALRTPYPALPGEIEVSRILADDREHEIDVGIVTDVSE